MARKVDISSLGQRVVRSVATFETEAQKLFARFEGSGARVVTLRESLQELSGLSHAQQSLFAQALGATEHGLYRAAYVLAWAAFMDVLQDKLGSDGWTKARSVCRSFPKNPTTEELREQYTEHFFVQLGKDCGLYGKTMMKSLHGMLSDRNACAHPGATDPGLNETLGYVTRLLKWAKDIQAKQM